VYVQTKSVREFVDWLWELIYPRVESTARMVAEEKMGERSSSFSFNRPKL
jgi:hypothetical protein